jgi:hypothetical protein
MYEKMQLNLPCLTHTGVLIHVQGLSMKSLLSRFEFGLLFTLAGAVLLACLGPELTQPAHYHGFADQRLWLALPFAMDVLTNLPFAIGGIWGLMVLRRLPDSSNTDPEARTSRALAALFFAGLVLTGLCSGFYHWQPDDAGLTADRLGMVVAFAGLLGLAAADRVSARAGRGTAGAVLLLGPLSVMVWSSSGNLLPWVVLQGGGMLLVMALAFRMPVGGAWGIAWGAVIVFYALAKALEFGDHAVFAWTQGWVSGHSLKHVMAALVAWPVIAVMHNAEQGRSCPVQPLRHGLSSL